MELLTWVEAIGGEVGHIRQQGELWQPGHLKCQLLVSWQLETLKAWLENHPGIHGRLVLRLLHQARKACPVVG